MGRLVEAAEAHLAGCHVFRGAAVESIAASPEGYELRLEDGSALHGVRADWTRPDAAITRALQEFGRDGVPLYVLYSGRPNDPPKILPQILTPAIVITALEKLEVPELRRSNT